MIRAGLFLYDHLGGRKTLPSSFGVDLAHEPLGCGTEAEVSSRLRLLRCTRRRRASGRVQCDVRSRKRRGHPHAHQADPGAARKRDLADHAERSKGESQVVSARAIVNAAGPWVKDVQDEVSAGPAQASVRHVKGSHIVVPRIHPEPHAYILQNSDHRIVFVIPYQHEFSLIGTTDITVEEYEHPANHERRDHLSVRDRQRIPRPSRFLPRMSCGPTAACGRSTTTARPIPPR